LYIIKTGGNTPAYNGHQARQDLFLNGHKSNGIATLTTE
jgi:hypothetical protein